MARTARGSLICQITASWAPLQLCSMGRKGSSFAARTCRHTAGETQ